MIDTCNCLNLRSPLIERGEAAVLPDVVSVREYKLCNDAVVVSNEPLVVTMPAQQWSYGLLLPLNHNALPPGITEIVVQLTLSVRNGGAIGIAGVDDALTGLTTAEQFIGIGESTVTTTVANPITTHAFVLRTVSNGGVKPEVIVSGASAHFPGAPQLTPRRHDLGYDLFIVLSMPKTATQTVEQTLLSLHPAVQVRRTHFISSESIKVTRERARSQSYPTGAMASLLYQAEYAENLAQEIDCIRTLGGRIAFLTGVRDPIARVVATIFQDIPEMIPGFAMFQKTSSKLVDIFVDYTTSQLRKVARQSPEVFPWHRFGAFFEEELKPITGTDLLTTPFDHDRGFTLVTNERGSILLYRFEDLEPALGRGLGALTGRQSIKLVNANLSAEKNYVEFYKTFQNCFRAPQDICSAIYDNERCVQHFYSEAEITSFKRKWQA